LHIYAGKYAKSFLRRENMPAERCQRSASVSRNAGQKMPATPPRGKKMPTKRQRDGFDPCSEGSWREKSKNFTRFPKIYRGKMPEGPQFGGKKPGKYAGKSRLKQKNAGKYASLKSLKNTLRQRVWPDI